MTQPYESLRQKLVQPFLLLGFVVSAILSLITFGLLSQIEEAAIRRSLQDELESFRHRVSLNKDAAPAGGKLLRGVYLPDPQLPRIDRGESQEDAISFRMIGDTEFSVLVSDVQGRPFALIYDRHYIQDALQQLALVLLLATILMTLLSFAVGYRLSRQVVQPILRLVDDVSRQAANVDLLENPGRFDEKAYPHDEIGNLVRELDQFSRRLYNALQREAFFAADVSHELRTPLAVILGAAEMLAELDITSDMARQRIQVIRRHATRMGQILDAMLLLGREALPPADLACSIHEVVEDVVNDCRPLLSGRPVELTLKVEGNPVRDVERALVYVLISNLVRNACAHTREGEVRIVVTEQAFSVLNTSAIAMQGQAILMKRHAKREGSEGHGLGLSIVGRVSERLGWSLTVTQQHEGVTLARLVWP